MLSGLNDPECRMNAGKTLFSQVMEFVPWKSFGRIIDRRRGDAGVRTLGCSDLFRIMAFAQLTWRESLRDIEACMAANQAKLFHMGLKSPPARLAHLSRPGPEAFRPAHLARVAARYRGLHGGQSSQAFPHGTEVAAGAIGASFTAWPSG